MAARVIPISKARQQVIDECHIWGHWWQPTTVDEDHPMYLVQHFECQRGCDSKRRQKIGREDTADAGNSIGNNYTYTEAYHFRHGDHVSAVENRRSLRLNHVRPRHRGRNRTRKAVTK